MMLKKILIMLSLLLVIQSQLSRNYLLAVEHLEVAGWNNSKTWNNGETGIEAWDVKFSVSGNTINGTLRYRVFDKNNPTAIVQLFVAVERKVVAVLYNSIPGYPGDSGFKSFSFNYDELFNSSGDTIYLAGTWAIGLKRGKDHYEKEDGGWRCPIGRLSARSAGNLKVPEKIKFTDHLRLKIGNTVFKVGLIRTGALNGEVALGKDGKIVTDRKILEKVLHAGAIYGFFPEEEREYRFHNFLGRVNYFQSMYQEALNLIPVMEFLSFYAFNLGPRAVVEALEIAVTGGGSLVAKGGKALKVIGKRVVKEVARSAAKEALKDLAKNPRTYILTTLYSLLQGSISQFEWIKKKAEELKQRKVIDYDELVQLEELYWKARVEGWIALKMYENIKGDLISNLLDALKNSVEQLIGDVEYPGEIVTTVFLANQFKKVLDTTQVMRVVAGEMAKLKKEREDMERIRHQYWDKDMELAEKIAKEFSFDKPQMKVSRYTNVRFHYSISYPGDILIPQGESTNADGQRFISRDGKAELIVYGSHNSLGRSLHELYNEQLKKFDSRQSSTVTYRVKRNDWFVLSGYISNNVFYNKTYLKDGLVRSFEFRYPASQKSFYDPITVLISQSFKCHNL